MQPAEPRSRSLAARMAAGVVLSTALVSTAPLALGASHREAPLIALDAPADITDVYMFRSYEAGKDDKVVLIMNVFPGGEPSSGPNYFTFDPKVRYAFNIDNDADGKAEDIVFEFEFKTEVRGLVDQLGLFVAYLGCGTRTPPCATPLPPVTNAGWAWLRRPGRAPALQAHHDP